MGFLSDLFEIDRARDRFYANREKYDATPSEYQNYPRHLLAQAGVVGESLGAPIEGLMSPIADAVDPLREPARGLLGRMNPATELIAQGGDRFGQYLGENPEAAALVKDIADASNLLVIPGAASQANVRKNASMRGFNEASGDVIVPNFYNPREKEFSPMIEGALEKYFPDQKSTTSKEVFTKDNKKQNAIRKAMGFGQWGVAGLSRVAENLVNPYVRATYAEFGVSPSYTKAYNDFMKADKTYNADKSMQNKIARDQALDVAHSQMQQLANIRAQAGAKAKVSEASDPFMIAATDPNSPLFFEPNKIGSNWYEQTGAKGANLEKIPPKDAKTAQEHFERVWLGGKTDDVKIIVKKPTGVGGNHFKDVVAQNKFFKHALKVFDVGQKKRGGVEFKNVSDLEEALRTQSERLVKTEGAKDKSKFFSVVKADDTGVWITGSRAGSAKVEGGINMLMKVEPNGNITGYMSDLHDFLDKVPGVKNVLEYTLPTKVLAVTPPMQSNIYTVMSEAATAKKFGEEAVSKRTAYPSAAGEQAAAVERIKDTGIPKPSSKEVAKQSVGVANRLAVGGLLTSQEEEQ